MKHHKSDSESKLPTSGSTIRLTTSATRSMRDIYDEIVRAEYPKYQPRNDFELLALGGRGYSHAEDGDLEALLDKEWAAFVSEFGGNRDAAMEEVQSSLNASVEVTGVSDLMALYEKTLCF